MKPEHLGEAAYACRGALDPFVENDWSATQAGSLTWDIRQTVTHVCDAVGWYAAHLALRCPRRLRFDFLTHHDSRPRRCRSGKPSEPSAKPSTTTSTKPA